MQDNQDFFSPAYMDEHLELPARTSGNGSQDAPQADLNSLLVHDLRSVYSTEGNEHARSLQNVWERLAEANTRQQHAASRSSREESLHILKPRAEVAPAKMRRKNRPNPVFAALAALLFVVIMVGSMLAIVHFTRLQPASPAGDTPTSTVQVSPTPIPGYPYPAPGSTTSTSPASPGDFSALTLSQDSKSVAASTRGKVWIWGATSNEQPFVFDPGAGNIPVVLAWSPGAPLLAVGSSQVQVIDPGNGKVHFTYPALERRTANTDGSHVTAVAWSPDGKLLAVAAQDPASGNVVSIWNVNKGGLPISTFTGQRSGAAISSISWSSDGRYIASANGQSVQAWDITSGVPIFERAISRATNVAWTPSATNAGYLAFVSDNTTQVWDVWHPQKMVSSYANTPNGALAWAPDGQYLASASGNAVAIWQVSNGALIYTYTSHTHPVRSLAWSQDGTYLASGEGSASGSNVVRVWTA